MEERRILGRQAVGSLSGRGWIRQKRQYYMPGDCISQKTEYIEEENLPRPRP